MFRIIEVALLKLHEIRQLPIGGRARSAGRDWIIAILASLSITAALTGCASLGRYPAVPLEVASQVVFLGNPDIRFYADRDMGRMLDMALRQRQKRKAYAKKSSKSRKSRPINYLVLSGGGEDGAFGAGLLVGWSERGDRPKFDLVTGISTGALSAPFAFLGSTYDKQLKSIYTNTTAHDIFEKRTIFAAVTNDAMADTTPLRHMISRYITKRIVRRIAEEHAKGRLLLIMTTNLDQGRAVIWNIGAIAETKHPTARHLIINILLASSAIPGMFPPVMLDVTINGKRHQEMHVDGGATAQAFLYPPSLSIKQAAARLKFSVAAFKKANKRVAYIIRNGRQFKPEKNIKRQTLAITSQALWSMTAAAGVNDTYRIHTYPLSTGAILW
jgi:predicted patatin/cPLA2 family phospholipase